ncbi:hypothetical protein COU76_04770 [Candidatus Peregrinibacteria bacterium CG10_big_fil_rev_8_21_14_0_10_49_10]|nr:MAG: hypothetical protein COU76_04770 [Candidatus Peregrinibacteria bacterium CG10_big_fil_rev_8_21_14_0_10_49_10]
MCSAKTKSTALAFCMYVVPPLLFQLVFVPWNVGMRQIVDHRCGGQFYATPSQHYSNIASVLREYENGQDCITGKYIDTDELLYGNFGDVIGPLNALLQYEVCFYQQTSMDNGRNVEGDVEQIILEEHTKVPREIRIEAESRRGFEVEEGGCEEIPSWAQGQLKLIRDVFQDRIDIELFEYLKQKKYIVSSAQDPSVYEAELFIEDTDIRVRPKFIRIYVFFGLLLAWIGVVRLLRSLIKEHSSHKR